MEELGKNLWLLLTLVIPGMTTYGTFRFLLVLYDCRFDKSVFASIDTSALLTTCLVVGVALVQQAFSIAIEAMLSSFFKRYKRVDRRYFTFFCERFQLAATGKMNESQTRVFGNFFLSVNVAIGQLIILGYLLYRGLGIGDAAVRVTAATAAAVIFSAGFRLTNAVSIVPLVKKPVWISEMRSKRAATLHASH